MTKKKLIIGLTGAPGSGKSTVARQFEKQGCAVIDADQLNHEVLTNPNVIQEIVSWWGKQIQRADGQVDREAIGRIVFEDPDKLNQLTQLVHPLIAEREKELISFYEGICEVWGVVLDVPLLFEADQDKWCDIVVFVDCEESIRQKRLKESRGWEEEKRKKIENLQLGVNFKAQKADYVIRNNSSMSETAVQVKTLINKIKTRNKT
jgi:dephospho-CoA kinase